MMTSENYIQPLPSSENTIVKFDDNKVSLRHTPACWTFVASSSPYCVFRNPSRYVHNNHENFQLNELHPNRPYWDYEAKRRAFEQSVFFLDSVIEEPIPTHLLTDTIYEDIKAARSPPSFSHRRNSLLSLQHGGTSLLLHCGGQYMDELVLRNCSFLQPQYEWKQQPGFSLNIGRGSPILQLATAGKTQFGLSSNIIARTSSEVFHLKTVDVSDLADGAKSCYGHILEPKGKWQLPEEIVDMSTSRSDWSYGYLVSKSGILYEWNPTSGIRKEKNSPFLSVHSSSTVVEHSVPPYMIETKNHPKLLYMVHGHQVFNIDTRTRRASTIFTNLSFEDSSDFNNFGGRFKQFKSSQSVPSPIHGIRTHDCEDHTYFLALDNAVMLMDSRYPKSHVFKQSTYGAHNTLLYKRVNALNKAAQLSEHVDVLVSASSSSPQIFSHCITSSVPQRSSGIVSNNPVSLYADFHSFDLLRTASSAGVGVSHRWQTEGFPVVDKVEPCVGVELIVLPRLQMDALDTATPDYCTLLIQQSNVGDVYVQCLTLNRPCKQQDRRNINNYISKESNDSDDEEENHVSLSKSLALLGNSSNKNLSKQNAMVNYPPIQTNLSVSNRSYASCSSSTSYSYAMKLLSYAKKRFKNSECGQLTRAFAAIHKYFYGKDKLHEFQGLTLDAALSKELDMIDSGFPVGSKVFRRYIPEDALMGRDDLLLLPTDVRRDLPTLPRQPHLLAVNAAPPKVTTLDEAEKLFRQYSKNISQYIEKSPKSLWEIWKLLSVLSMKRVDINLIRHILLFQAKYEETWWSSRIDQSSRVLASFYSDGCFVQVPPRSLRNSKKKRTAKTRCNEAEQLCECLQDIQIWCLGRLQGGRLNNKNWKINCRSKYCLVPHRLIYSHLGNKRTSMFPNDSDDSFTRQRVKNRTDLTVIMCDELDATWDMTVDTVYCAWPNYCGDGNST